MKITLKVAPAKDFLEKIEALSDEKQYQKIHISTVQEMSQWMYDVLAYKTRVEAFKHSTGKLQRRWHMSINDGSGYVTNDAKHLPFLNNGTGIYGPRKERIVMRWLIGKIIPLQVEPSTIKKGMAYIVGENGKAIIFRKCTQEAINRGAWQSDGIKPMHFIEKTFDEFEKIKLEDILQSYAVGLFS